MTESSQIDGGLAVAESAGPERPARGNVTEDDFTNSPAEATTNSAEQSYNHHNHKQPTSQINVLSEKKKDTETATDATGESAMAEDKPDVTDELEAAEGANGPIVSTTKKSRPPYKYDPEKITLRFLFANRDGLSVTVECNPSDTVGEVKGALMSVWPEALPKSDGENVRLVCMGKGYLMPDTRTLEDCQVPVFKTHPTPINVSIKPDESRVEEVKSKKGGNDAAHGDHTAGGRSTATTSNSAAQANQGCACSIL